MMRFESLCVEAYNNWPVMCVSDGMAFSVNGKGLLDGPPFAKLGVGAVFGKWICKSKYLGGYVGFLLGGNGGGCSFSSGIKQVGGRMTLLGAAVVFWL